MNIRAEVRATPAEVRVTRGGAVESVHYVSVAVVDAEGALVAGVGDLEWPIFYRSAAKPLQALPLVEDRVMEKLGLTDEELALCCASHNAEPEHVRGAIAILAKAGVGPDALACGPHLPMRQQDAESLIAQGQRPTRIHNNCSGKHAGMLALAVANGWPTAGYHLPDHPVQQRMLREVSRWTGLGPERIDTAVDGCGIVCFAVPLGPMALSFARFARAADLGEGAARVVSAMVGHPHMVAGQGRLCTALMAQAGDRVFVKTGAEGVYCAGIRGSGIGVALKVMDGGKRASDLALLRVLELLGVLRPADLDALGEMATPPVRNTLGDLVGEVSAGFTLPASQGSTGAGVAR
jgi:L-asparaginase II